MMRDLIDFTSCLFPSIEPYVKDKVRESLKQFYSKNDSVTYFTVQPHEFLSQGDIFDNVPFIKLEEDGTVTSTRSKGMLISNTCSASRDESIVLAPFFTIEELGMEKRSVVDNLNYRLMHLPERIYEDYVIDFSLMNTFDVKLINKMIEMEQISKESSLNLFGFYFLLCKLTICFFRPEDEGVQENRKKDFENCHNCN